MDLVTLERGQLIRQEALRLGFDDVGFAPAEEIEEETGHFKHWLERGYHAGMDYMARNVAKRTDPGKLVEGARSVVVVLQNYMPPRNEKLESGLKLAKYAYCRASQDLPGLPVNVRVPEPNRQRNALLQQYPHPTE